MGLPVLARGMYETMPESLGINMARNELRIIAALAAERVEVHDYASHVAGEVVDAIAALEVPNTASIVELQKEYSVNPKSPFQDDSRPPIMGRNAIARQMVRPETEEETGTSGVTDREIGRDVLARLHPDRREVTEVNAGTDGTEAVTAAEEDIFKAITQARENEEDPKVQALYARTVASLALGTENTSAEMLEKTLWKARIALQASKGRFGSKEEADAWKEREIGLAPYRIRANLLRMTMQLFGQSIKGDLSDKIVLPRECHMEIVEGFKAGESATDKIWGDEITLEDLSTADLNEFDTRLEDLLDNISTLFQLKYQTLYNNWTPRRVYVAQTAGNRLSSVSELLQGRDRALEIVLASLKRKSGGRPVPSTFPNHKRPLFEESIPDGKHYDSQIIQSDNSKY